MSSSAILAARHFGIKVLALSPKDYAMQTYSGEVLKRDDVVYYDYAPPFEPLPEHPKSTSIIVYHACEWDKNHLDVTKRIELGEWLSRHSPHMTFMTEIVDGQV